MKDALANEGIDAVIICSPNHVHFDQTLHCITHGLPVLVEKPLTDTLESASRLVDAAEKCNTPVLVGHHRTYSPLLEVAQSFLSSKSFGRPVALQGTALFYKPEDYYKAGEWRTRKGGGPILINLIHEIGIMRHLFGEINHVTAHVSHATRNFEVEDTAAISISFTNGALGTFLLSDAAASSKSWEMTAGENPAYPSFPNQNCYHFAGTMGSLDFPSMHARSYINEDVRSWWKPFEEETLNILRQDPLAGQLQHFVKVARGLEAPIVSIKDGYHNMVVLEAVQRAAETGSVVRISECMI
jgi:predicted dehydrogenase